MNLTYFWSKLMKKVRLSSKRNCSIHHKSRVGSGSNLVNVSMDKYSYCGYNCEMSRVIIGSFCSIASGVAIGGGMHPVNWVSTSPVFYSGRNGMREKFSEFNREPFLVTRIGHDVWIGQNVLIKQGVAIGTGAVIGMGSIVTKDVEPYSIVVGNPAKEMRKRFDPKIINDLLKSEWWKMDEKTLRSCAEHIRNPADFFEATKEMASCDE